MNNPSQSTLVDSCSAVTLGDPSLSFKSLPWGPIQASGAAGRLSGAPRLRAGGLLDKSQGAERMNLSWVPGKPQLLASDRARLRGAGRVCLPAPCKDPRAPLHPTRQWQLMSHHFCTWDLCVCMHDTRFLWISYLLPNFSAKLKVCVIIIFKFFILIPVLVIWYSVFPNRV